MAAISSLPAASNPAPPVDHERKLGKAARDFEAVLLNSLLGKLEHTFSSIPGKEADAVADNYQSLGMQALASSLAARGGLGIADMIVKSLAKRDHAEPATQEKSLTRGASLGRPF